MSHGLFSKLGGDEDREVLRKAGVCFRCRQPGHMWMDCPEGNKERSSRLTVKVESVEQPVVESDQVASPYVLVSTICISVRIASAKSPALIDTGASVNTVSPRIATHSNLPRLPVTLLSASDKHSTPQGFLSKKRSGQESASPRRSGHPRNLLNSLSLHLRTQRQY